LDVGDHGGPHIQNGNFRYDAVTLEPIPHKGVTPPRLTANEVEELRKSGVLDQLRKRFPQSIVREASEEMTRELTKGGARCLTKRAARELAKRILQRIPVVTLIFVATDYAEGGVDKAVKNAVIPGELIEQVADEGKRKYDAWLDQKEKNFRDCICRKAGLDPEDLE